MKFRNKKFIFSSILIAFLVVMIFASAYAIIGVDFVNNITNVNVTLSSRPVFSATTPDPIALDIPAVGGTSNFSYVAASDNSTINIALTSDAPTTCTYDIVFSWQESLNVNNQYSITEGADKEYTVSGQNSLGYSFEETQVSNYSSTNFDTLLYSGSITANGSMVTDSWNINVNFYKTVQDQTAKKGKSFVGSVHVTNILCDKFVDFPIKGRIINVDLNGDNTAESYRVLRQVNSSVVEIMYMGTDLSSTYYNSGSINTYENSNLDTYINTTWYNSLSSSAKAAIVDKTFTQQSWKWYSSSATPTESEYYNASYKSSSGWGWLSGTTYYKMALLNNNYSSSFSRHAYTLGVQDIIDYLEATPSMTTSTTTIITNNIYTLFWNSTSSQTANIWLSSAVGDTSNGVWQIVGSSGSVNTTTIASNTNQVRPVVQIRINDLVWS